MDKKTLLQDGDISKDDEELFFDPYNLLDLLALILVLFAQNI